MPPIGWSALGWIALVPALVATRKAGFAASFGSGIGLALVAAWFLAQGFLLPKTVQGGSPAWIYTGYALFGLVIGFVFAFRSVISRLKGNPLALAGMATLMEVPLLLYLPAHLGLSMHRSTALLELCAWTGIWGVSFVVWWMNFAVAERVPEPLDLKLNAEIIPARSYLLVFLTVLLSGGFLREERGKLYVCALQTRSQDPKELAALNRKATELGAKLVVWPELSAMSIASGANTEALVELAKEPGQAPFVTTYPDATEPKPYNTAALFSASGESARYKKRKPFAAERQIHASGSEPVTVQFGEYRVAMAICFDSCFPTVMRQSARHGNPDFMVLPSLDPETPGGVCQALHGAYTAFAAAAIGLPIIRSEITSHSQIFDAHGRIHWQSQGIPDDIVSAKIKPGKRWTFQTYAGDWFLGVCGVLVWFGFRRSADSS